MRRLAPLPCHVAAAAVFALVFMPGFVRNGWSQNWMTPAYSTYTSYTSDGTYIYTSVTVSGTTNGTCPSFPAWLANKCHTTTHTPQVYNVTGGSGGWQYGNSTYWNSYLSLTNSQQIAATPGTEYTFDYSSDVLCSFIGAAIYQAAGGGIGLRITVTTYKYASVANGVCTYNIFCGHTQHTCGADKITALAPCPYTYYVLDFLVVRIGNTSTCFPVGIASGQNTPADCS